MAMFNTTADAKYRIDLNVFPIRLSDHRLRQYGCSISIPVCSKQIITIRHTLSKCSDARLLLEAENFWYLDDKFSETSGYGWWRRICAGD